MLSLVWLTELLLAPLFLIIACPILLLLIATSTSSVRVNRDQNDNDGWWVATLASLALVFLITNFYGISLTPLKEQPWLVVAGLFVYIMCGLVWANVKWRVFLSKAKARYVKFKSDFMSRRNLSESFLTDVDPAKNPDFDEETKKAVSLIKDYANCVSDNFLTYTLFTPSSTPYDVSLIRKAVTPKAASHSTRIIQWIAFWPVSFVWTMLNDPLRSAATYAFNRVSGTFQKMSDKAFSDI